MPEMEMPDFLQNQGVDDIQKKMLDSLPGDIDKTEGGFAWDFTRPTALEKSEFAEFILAQAIQCIFPMYSYGSYLDNHGMARGMTRRAANAAYGLLYVTAAPGTTIPQGTIFSTASVDGEPSIDFVTLEAARPTDDNPVRIPVEAVEPGTIGNVSAHSITFCSSSVSNIRTIDNPEQMSGGTEEEDDDSFRNRIVEYDQTQGSSYVGNDADYKRWAMEVPGVGSAIIIPAEDTTGLVTIVLIDANGQPANDQLCQEVYKHIMHPEDRELRLAPINAFLEVTPPHTIAIKVSAIVELNGKTTMDQARAEFVALLQAYLVEAAEEREVKYSHVSSCLADVSGINDYRGVYLNDGAANIPIGIADMATIGIENVTFTEGNVEGNE